MRRLNIDDRVRLTRDLPYLSLSRGTVGVVRSTWFAPVVAYEVEFHQIGNDYETRAVVMEEQVALDEAAEDATAE